MRLCFNEKHIAHTLQVLDCSFSTSQPSLRNHAIRGCIYTEASVGAHKQTDQAHATIMSQFLIDWKPNSVTCVREKRQPQRLIRHYTMLRELD